MGKPFNKSKKGSPFQEFLDRKKRASVNDPERLQNFQISLQYYIDDVPESGTLRIWEKECILADAIAVLAGYCKRPLREQIDGYKFTIYGGFPPEGKTDYAYPDNVPEDAHWARIHVKGLPVIIGHVVGNTFFIVFLDKNHRFWISER